MARIKDYVVSFKLPTDEGLFIYHATNTRASTPDEAISNVQSHIPGAYSFAAELGVVTLYGSPWATYDPTLGAQCFPCKKFVG